MSDSTEKIMVVTGASRGIGAAVARLAGRRGFTVVVNYLHSAAAADDVVGSIAAAGGKALAIQADVTRLDETLRLFADIDRRVGPPDVLVNNAGIVGGVAAIDDVDEALLTRVFAANVFSTFYATREAVRRMSTAKGGKGGVILNMSSAAARHGGLPQEAHYAASKGAVDSLTVALARELGRQGIRVNALRPGLIDTAIHEVHGGAATIAALTPNIPLGRAGTAEEVAETVLWLASDAAAYLPGALIDVSGGR